MSSHITAKGQPPSHDQSNKTVPSQLINIMYKAPIIALLFLVLVSDRVSAAIVTYAYTGTVTFVAPSGAPYGLTIPAFSPVSGRITYDTEAAPTHPDTGSTATGFSTGYLQQIAQGFTGTFGDVEVSADEYLVLVADNVPGPSMTVVDRFRIVFSNSPIFTPALGAPLMVNGTEQTVGSFSIQLTAPSTLYSDESLPPSLNLADFSSTTTQFMDTPSGTVDVMFSVESLVAVPEPATAPMLLLGIGALLFLRHRSRRGRGHARERSIASNSPV